MNDYKKIPSASIMTRVYNCPASFKLNALEVPTSSEAADEGTLLHSVCEQGFPAHSSAFKDALFELNDEQRETVLAALKAAYNEHADLGDLEPIEYSIEERMFSKSGLFSGKADLILRTPIRGVIIDYKFGRGDVERAESNMQMAALATLLFEKYEAIKTVDVVLIQPRALDKYSRTTRAQYKREQIDEIRVALEAACLEALGDSPSQQCGYWCTYCAASKKCQALQNQTSELAKFVSDETKITVQNARELFEKTKAVEKFCAKILSELKNFVLENPNENHGLTMVDGISKREITDSISALNFIEEKIGRILTREEMINLTQIKVSKLEEFLQATLKPSKIKEFKASIKNEMNESGFIQYKQNQQILKAKD